MSASDNPFGTTITADDILETITFFDGWEDRYRYIIDLGKELHVMPDNLKDDEHLVRGCQSQVWINSEQKGERLYFEADSDAFIVKGLLSVVLAAYNGKTAREIQDFDVEAYFESLGLIRHLSMTRGNGLRAMVSRIRGLASL